MTKYSEEFKAKIVREYLDGSIGYEALAVKHGVKSKTQIQNWVAAYRAFGAEGLAVKAGRSVYSAAFKRQVLSYMAESGATFSEAAFRFGINNPATVTAWHTAFLKGGSEALKRPRGRPARQDQDKTE